jgi:hypothetical protein
LQEKKKRLEQELERDAKKTPEPQRHGDTEYYLSFPYPLPKQCQQELERDAKKTPEPQRHGDTEYYLSFPYPLPKQCQQELERDAKELYNSNHNNRDRRANVLSHR